MSEQEPEGVEELPAIQKLSSPLQAERSRISKVRRTNLRPHLKHGDISLLAIKIGVNPNYLSQLVSVRSKRILTDDVAQRLETALSLPRGSLNSDTSTPGSLIQLESKYEPSMLVAELTVSRVLAGGKFDTAITSRRHVVSVSLPNVEMSCCLLVGENSYAFMGFSTKRNGTVESDDHSSLITDALAVQAVVNASKVFIGIADQDRLETFIVDNNPEASSGDAIAIGYKPRLVEQHHG
jgi:hypothetical protein